MQDVIALGSLTRLSIENDAAPPFAGINPTTRYETIHTRDDFPHLFSFDKPGSRE